MKADKDFELKYRNVLKECIALFEEESRHEKEQISLAIKIGEKINEIADSVEDKDAIFKKISRDIFRARKKVITPSKIAEYRQLYLNFQSMETVETMAKAVMSDMTVGMLTEMALKDGQSKSKPKGDDSALLTMLKKANRLLDKIEITIEEKQPDDEDIGKILDEMDIINSRAQTILKTLRNGRGRGQMDIFKMHDIQAAVHQWLS
jgi:hypothetical protein